MEKKRKKIGERGVITFSVFLFIILVMLVLFFSVAIPMYMQFTTKIYSQGEKIINDANAGALGITNPKIKENVQTALSSAGESYESQMTIMSVFVQYSWIIIILLILMIGFLYSRMQVESQGVFR